MTSTAATPERQPVGIEDELTAALAKIGHLEAALQTSRRIGIAIGIVIARKEVTEHAAFAMLVRESQRADVKLHVVAEHIAATGDVDHLAAGASRNRRRS